MGKHSRCVTGVCETRKKHSNMDGYIIMLKLPKDGAVRAAWMNTILKDRNQWLKKVFILL